MITKVEIENFQSHKKTVIEFVPGTNVIIGRSDAGKSAVFRAINWVISNRPLGDAFRSEWGGNTRVVLHTSEENVVERIRSTTGNEYIINGQPLKAFGSEVPEEVTNILQLDLANIQAQMEPPFLLANSPGEAARLLNKAASIDDIDYAIAGLKKAYNDISRNIKHNEEQLKEYKEQMEQYSDIPTIESKLKGIEELEKSRDKKDSNLHNLINKVDRAQELSEWLEATKYVPDLLSKCNAAEEQLLKWREHGKEIQSLEQLVSQASRLQKNIKNTDQRIQGIEEQYHELAPDICPLCGNQMKKEIVQQ